MPRPKRAAVTAGQVRELASALGSELALEGGIGRAAWHSRVSRDAAIRPEEAARMADALHARMTQLKTLHRQLRERAAAT